MTAAPWTDLPADPVDIRLIVADMDGTLLDTDGEVPDAFWPLLDRLAERGVEFVPASGRQYATLAAMFGARVRDYIAENGNLVMRDGVPISTAVVDDAVVAGVIAATRAAATRRNLGLVVCGVASAYIERNDPPFRAEVDKYYAQLAVVDDLTTVSDDVLKLAVFDFDDSTTAFHEAYERFAADTQVVISGQHWLDIQLPGVDKGRGVRALQDALGITGAQTAIFGDYLNDLEMLATGDWSFAMDNAHAEIRAAARFIAPSNADHGVLQVIERLLAAAAPA